MAGSIIANTGWRTNAKRSLERGRGIALGTQEPSFLRLGGPGWSLWPLWGSLWAPRGSLLAPGGVTLGTPGATLATQGVTFEAQGSKKWIPPMIVFRCGTILELPGVIWGAFWGHVGVFLGSFFGIFSRCVFDGVFGHFGHQF